MKSSQKHLNKAGLLATAKALSDLLAIRSAGTCLRVSRPSKAETMNSDGWMAVVGSLGRGMPVVQIWLDRFTGHDERKYYVGFRWTNLDGMKKLTRSVAKHLWPVRRVTMADTEEEAHFMLKDRLGRDEFNEPVLEMYAKHALFGVFDPTRETSSRVNTRFCDRAAGFILDVVRSMPGAEAETTETEIYPCCENRRWVKAHLSRERSRYLAAQCKERDGYRCVICTKTFAEMYGAVLGAGFAEAHHTKPLGTLGDRVKTNLEDLITVCANCHRMLHRMEGRSGDIKRLQAIVTRHRNRRK